MGIFDFFKRKKEENDKNERKNKIVEFYQIIRESVNKKTMLKNCQSY